MYLPFSLLEHVFWGRVGAVWWPPWNVELYIVRVTFVVSYHPEEHSNRDVKWGAWLEHGRADDICCFGGCRWSRGHSRPHLPRRPTRESIKGMSHRNRWKWDTRTSWPSQEDNTVQWVRPSVSDTSWYFFNIASIKVPPSFSSPPRRGNMSHDIISVQYFSWYPPQHGWAGRFLVGIKSRHYE